MADEKIPSPDLETLPFDSNRSYIGWEMARIQARIKAYLGARDDDDPAGFLAIIKTQAEDRRRMNTIRSALVDDGKPIPFELLVRRHELDDVEQDALWLGLAPHLSANTRALLLHAQGLGNRTTMEPGFFCEMVSPARNLVTHRHLVDEHAKLVRHGLLRVWPPMRNTSARLGLAVEAHHHVAAAVLGDLAVDERLARCAVLSRPQVKPFELILPHDSQRHLDRFLEAWHDRRNKKNPEGPCSLLVSGEDGTGKTRVAECLATMQGSLLLTIHPENIHNLDDAAELLALSAQNARFVQAVWHIVRPEQIVSLRPQLAGMLGALIASYPGLAIIESGDREAFERAMRAPLDYALDLSPPDSRCREQLWESLLPQDARPDASVQLTTLAATYELSGGQIKAAVAWAARRSKSQGHWPTLTQDDLKSGAWTRLRSRLGQLAQASRVRLRLPDLVLPPAAMAQVNDVLAACRNRGRLLGDWGFDDRLVTGKGLVALFHGEAGTGKTLCAEILANELELQLHIVSIPKIVSKWVGETEKNVRDIFHQARAHNSMLLFDEADALFARRVKVEKSADHFQNMEVNNLLQEIERFEGIVILTTNLETNMDPAFARRILYRIEFPNPEQAQREMMWRKLIPEPAPIADDVDFDYLAEAFELTGGQIKNAIIRAAYKSLDANTALSMEALEQAAQDQAAAAGRLVRGEY